MVNSGINNGLPFHANHEMLTVWLKEQLNWDGMIVTDWADIHNLWKRDKIAADYKEAIMLAINAGIDMSMTPYDMEFCTLLKELVEEGKVSEERIDDAVERIIRFKLRLGLFETLSPILRTTRCLAAMNTPQRHLNLPCRARCFLKMRKACLPIQNGKRILVIGLTPIPCVHLTEDGLTHGKALTNQCSMRSITQSMKLSAMNMAAPM